MKQRPAVSKDKYRKSKSKIENEDEIGGDDLVQRSNKPVAAKDKYKKGGKK